MPASIVTLRDGQTKNIQYPKTVKSALMKDDGTPLNPIEPSQIINDITTGGVAVPLSAQQGVVLDNKIGILSALTTIDKTSVVGAINENSSAIGQIANGTVPSGDTVKFVGRTIDIFLSTNSTALSSANFNTLITENKMYQVISGTNTNNNDVSYGQLTVKATDGYVIQKLYDVLSNKEFVRKYDNISWSAWKEIATTESAIGTLLNGWTGGAVITKSGNIVTVELDLSNGVVSSSTVLINIPMDFRPKTIRYVSITGIGGGNYVIQVNPNGDLTINNGATTWTTAQKVGSICFSII